MSFLHGKKNNPQLPEKQSLASVIQSAVTIINGLEKTLTPINESKELPEILKKNKLNEEVNKFNIIITQLNSSSIKERLESKEELASLVDSLSGLQERVKEYITDIQKNAKTEILFDEEGTAETVPIGNTKYSQASIKSLNSLDSDLTILALFADQKLKNRV